LSGTARNAPPGHELWLFLYVASVSKYYAAAPGSLKLRPDGRWTGSIYVGGSGQPGERFTIWLVDMGPRSLRILNTDVNGQNSGFDRLRLAGDTTLLASVTFVVHD
jgi:hypothetical protein